MLEVASAIIERSNQILLLRRSSLMKDMPGLWNFPGGGIDPRETPAQAASREILEETGLIVDPDALMALRSTLIPLNPRDRPRAHFFYTDRALGQVTINWESDRFRWTPLVEVKKYHLIPGTKGAFITRYCWW